MKPIERIDEIEKQLKDLKPDSGYTGRRVEAIVCYLQEEWEKDCSKSGHKLGGANNLGKQCIKCNAV